LELSDSWNFLNTLGDSKQKSLDVSWGSDKKCKCPFLHHDLELRSWSRLPLGGCGTSWP